MSRKKRSAPRRRRHSGLYISVEFTTGRGCGKRRFSTYADAELVLAMALGRHLQGDSRRREQRIYQCHSHCGGWHLTSQTPRRDTPVKQHR